jgi:hypothetical protein
MVFAEYFNPKLPKSTVVVEYDPNPNIYRVIECINGKPSPFVYEYESADAYREHIDTIRKNGYTRRNIFNGKN